MKESEAIKEFQQNIDMPFGSNISREASKLAIQALEKQIPKNPYHISQVDDNDNANVECPACHATTDYAVNAIKRGHCWKCGQLLDWSDEE
jgi:hypothetical protein